MAEVTSATNRAAATISAPGDERVGDAAALDARRADEERAAELAEVGEELRQRRELRRLDRLGLALVDEADAVGLEAHDDGDIRRQGRAGHDERDGRQLRVVRAVGGHDHELLLICHVEAPFRAVT